MNIRNPKHWKDCLSTPSVILSKPQKHKTYICVDTEQVISRLFWSNSLKPNFSLSFLPSFSLPPCQPSSLSSSLSLSLFAFVCVSCLAIVLTVGLVHLLQNPFFSVAPLLHLTIYIYNICYEPGVVSSAKNTTVSKREPVPVLLELTVRPEC